ncbi:MAG TPA: CBS domain-containing protein [Candidatus Thermoplasmatota archaeon]|nr:CBS domain-containing protein [Candidatus Thermoplasmatota archaeon]
MTKQVVCMAVEGTAEDAAKLMREKNVGCVVVLDRSERVVGLVTDRDLVIRCLADGRTGHDVSVEEVMTRNPAVCTLDDNIFSVLDTMRSAGVARRIPVVDNDNHCLGIVSISDLSVVMKRLLDGLFLEEIHNSQNEAYLPTGGKNVGRELRHPTEPHPRQMETRVQHPMTPGSSAAGVAGGATSGAGSQRDGGSQQQSRGQQGGSQQGKKGSRNT